MKDLTVTTYFHIIWIMSNSETIKKNTAGLLIPSPIPLFITTLFDTLLLDTSPTPSYQNPTPPSDSRIPRPPHSRIPPPPPYHSSLPTPCPSPIFSVAGIGNHPRCNVLMAETHTHTHTLRQTQILTCTLAQAQGSQKYRYFYDSGVIVSTMSVKWFLPPDDTLENGHNWQISYIFDLFVPALYNKFMYS